MPSLESQAQTPQAPLALAGRVKLSRRKRLLFTAVFAFVLLVLAVFALEFGLRLFAPQRLLPRYVTDSGFGIRVHCPNIVTHHTTAEYRITIRTNSLGMRSDREYSFDKPPDTVRIVVLGDSFTMGYEVELEESYPFLVEKLLRERGIPAEVINLGVSGFGTAEELVMLEKRGLKFQPDVVVVGYFNNDISDNIRSMLFVLGADGGLVRKNTSYLPAAKLNNFLFSMAPYRWLAENSHLQCWLRENLSEVIQKEWAKSNAEQAGLDNNAEKQLTARLLDEIKRVAQEQHAAFCLLQIPSITNRSNLPIEMLARVAPDEIIDMRPIQEARWDNGALYWHRSDGHWTPAGQRLAADTLVGYLVRRPPGTSGRQTASPPRSSGEGP